MGDTIVINSYMGVPLDVGKMNVLVFPTYTDARKAFDNIKNNWALEQAKFYFSK